MSRRWWQVPQLRTNTESERKTTWLELFFDLIFVVVVAELSHDLADDLTAKGVISFILLFIPAWWVWIGATVYSDRFDTDDVPHRVLMFALMLAVAALAYNVHYATDKSSIAFAFSYIAARMVIIFLWLRAGYSNKVAQPMTTRFAIGFTTSVLLWLVSVFVPTPWRFVLWGIGLFIDLVTPITTGSIQRKLPRFSPSHMVERFGLFTIIVLGESIVAAVSGATEQYTLTLPTIILGGLGLALAFTLWWIYFDGIINRSWKLGFWYGLGRHYFHLPLLMALTAIGAAVLKVVSKTETALSDELRWLLCGSVAVALVSISLIEWVCLGDKPENETPRRLVRFGAAFLALGIGLLGGLHPIIILGLLLVLCLAQIVFDISKPLMSPEHELEPELASKV